MITVSNVVVIDSKTGQRINLADVTTIARRAREAPSARSRAAITAALRDGFTPALLRIEADLRKRLDAGWGVLVRTPDTEKEGIWLGWLARYEAVCDALSVIWDGVIADRPARVTQRRAV